ncbi:GH92 family glycosyl hydrolase [Bacteroidota bacterium]
MSVNSHRIISHLIIGIISIFILTNCNYQSREQRSREQDFTIYVDPMIGTGAHGHTFPGATLPFGMVQLSPDNGVSGWDWCGGYHYSSDTIAGFSHTHVSGTGVGDMYDISLLPINSEIVVDDGDSIPFSLKPYYAHFSHEIETAEPGYYKVLLDNTGIMVELTATERAGFHKYTYPDEGADARLVVNLMNSINSDQPLESHIKMISDTLYSGYRFSTGWAKDQKVFFAMRFSQPVKAFKGYSPDSTTIHEEFSIQGEKGVIGFFGFDLPESGELLIKLALSSVSEENALLNLNEEMPNWDFESVREQARTAWNNELKKIIVDSDDEDLLRIFYTAMYHSLLTPNLYSDVNNQYRGADDLIHQSEEFPNYYTYSLWDTYRAAHPLYTIIQQERIAGLINGMITHYKETGLLPVWSLWGNETNTMIGYHAIPVIVDAYFKGLLNDFDPDSLYEALTVSANQEIRFTPLYKEYGYVPADTIPNTVSTTLEYAYDDWCIAQMARDLGNNDDYMHYLERSKSYRNVFDNSTKLMRPRMADGTWKSQFNPLDASYGNDYTEGNAWQYTWYVPHDIDDLINLMGGDQIFNRYLDSLFTMSSELDDDKAFDVSGLIGQYVHGNEPSHHIAYLYNFSGQPWKAQERVNQIMTELYKTGQDGLCGNEDCGQMSAWYILSALGFYPVNPANGRYELGTPIFSQAEIVLQDESTFRIIANDLSKENIYVESVLLNEEPLNRQYLLHDDIMEGGILEFNMTDKPAR